MVLTDILVKRVTKYLNIQFLMQSTDDDKDWKIINKRTPTRATGPTADHSTGRGYYAYLEASGILVGSRVRFFV